MLFLTVNGSFTNEPKLADDFLLLKWLDVFAAANVLSNVLTTTAKVSTIGCLLTCVLNNAFSTLV